MPAKKKNTLAKPTATITGSDPALLSDLRDLITSTRQTVARGVNAALVMLYWSVGDRIRRDVLHEKRATYGSEILPTLSSKLVSEFGRGYSPRNLASMIRFAEIFPDPEILQSLTAKLSWTHFLHLIYFDDSLKRDFYAEMCRVETWNTRTLWDKIDSMLFERTALSKKPAKLAAMEIQRLRDEDRMTPDLVFRDPYILDFLGLEDTYAEQDLEAAILREIESFILELGTGFAFIARQKRMTIDHEDHYLDLLFYHRHLRCMIAIELKLGEFKAAYKGQMELYLAWLNRHERTPSEEKPIGLILCAGKKSETVELLDMEKDGIRVSSYWTEALPKDLLQKKLHEAVVIARANLLSRTATENPPTTSSTPITHKRAKSAPTRQQGQFLAFIREYIMRNEQGLAPTRAAFQKFFDLTPPSVNSMLIRLEQRGFIQRKPGQARGIQLVIKPDLIPPLERKFKF
ncbi:MAG: PDDEXK nuclease domain-containing protein [Luteolibacter sp.]|nr:PDDEXK nuclease domain-containing protein [Luteolibacter sp.]